MANVTTGQGVLVVDLIDDMGVDAISFHDEFDELHRVRITGRDGVFYGPGRTTHMHAKAWVGKVCVYQFETRLIPAGVVYSVHFDA